MQNDFLNARNVIDIATQYNEPMHNSILEALKGIVHWRQGNWQEAQA